MSTSNVAANAWSIAITVACLPICLISSNLNSVPIENAIKPKATCEITSKDSTASLETNPSPSKPMSLPNAPRQ